MYVDIVQALKLVIKLIIYATSVFFSYYYIMLLLGAQPPENWTAHIFRTTEYIFVKLTTNVKCVIDRRSCENHSSTYFG